VIGLYHKFTKSLFLLGAAADEKKESKETKE